MNNACYQFHTTTTTITTNYSENVICSYYCLSNESHENLLINFCCSYFCGKIALSCYFDRPDVFVFRR